MFSKKQFITAIYLCLELVAAENRGHVQNALTLAIPLKHTHTTLTARNMYYKLIHASCI